MAESEDPLVRQYTQTQGCDQGSLRQGNIR